ncbi:hypothetical protein L916_13264 [Phytophthora nicotianae]|uniref:Uncharacterized protein n=1 Tax=Phytophthora nicotianae TaxID=4792 RepID=W2IK99_PHYNI|nr:hypothetical protein L916_13264 [Phytophthora nicotianae]
MSETTNGVTFQVTTHEETAITERKYAKITLPRVDPRRKGYPSACVVVTTMRDGQGYVTTERSSGPTMTKMSLKSGGSYQ